MKLDKLVPGAGEGLFWVLLATCFAAILISFGFFPWNDDWAFQQTVERWGAGNPLRFSNWIAFSFLWQAIWGRLFTLWGFTSRALVVSTVTAALLALLFFRVFLLKYGIPRHVALLGVACLCFNPYLFTLSFTFMSDVHYIAWLVGASLLYKCGLEESRPWVLAGAALMSSAALLVRQNGILIAAGVVIAVGLKLWLEHDGLSTFPRPAMAAALGLPFLVFAAFNVYYFKLQGPTETFLQTSRRMHMLLTQPMDAVFLKTAPMSVLVMLVFLGFSTLPLLPLTLASLKRDKPTAVLLLICSVGLVASCVRAKLMDFPGRELPYAEAKVGLLGTQPVLVPYDVVKAIGAISVVSAAVLLTAAIRNLWPGQRSLWRNLLSGEVLWITIFQTLFVVVMPDPFSKYALPLVPFAILVLLAVWSKGRYPNRIVYGMSLALAVGMALFSVGTEVSGLAENEAVWKTASSLLQKGASPKEVEAGFAWDCWHFYEYSRQHPEETAPFDESDPWWIRDMTPVMTPKYVVTNSTHLPNYFAATANLQTVLPVRKVLGWKPDPLFIYLLRRSPSGPLSSEIDIAHTQSQDQLRAGWWSLETVGESHQRWTKGKSTVVLGMAPARSYIWIRGFVVVRYFKNHAVTLAVTANGEMAGQHTFTDEGAFDLAFPVPAEERSKDQIVVTLSLSETFHSPTDPRELGVLVTYIGLGGPKP